MVSRGAKAAGENAGDGASAGAEWEPDPRLERVAARLVRDERRAVGIA